jgi:hypothetical protein
MGRLSTPGARQLGESAIATGTSLRTVPVAITAAGSGLLVVC